MAERGREVTTRTRAPRVAVRGLISEGMVLRSALPATAPSQPVAFEVLARTGDSSRTQPGVPRGPRRTGEFRTRMMPVFDRFVPTLVGRLPDEYVLVGADSAVIEKLKLHGIYVDTAGASLAKPDRMSSHFRALACHSIKLGSLHVPCCNPPGILYVCVRLVVLLLPVDLDQKFRSAPSSEIAIFPLDF